MTITEILAYASTVLQNKRVDEPYREASSLLEYAFRKNRAFIVAHPEYELEKHEEDLFLSFVERRANREPFHYIIGHKEFYGLDFEVTPDVLIPRPETEMLVHHSIEILTKLEAPLFCEVGTGSGCIAISILNEVGTSSAIGLEISENAINITKRNAERHRVSERLILNQSNLYSALEDEKFDLIVTNPPYIPGADMDGLQFEVRDFEPHLALTDGGDGLSMIGIIVDGSVKYLKPGGFLQIEIGAGQADAVEKMFDRQLWDIFDILPDFQSIPRMVKARLR